MTETTSKFDTSVGEKYSTFVGGIFVFNLIVGIGAITMPQGFEQAGVGFGSIVLLLIGFASFVSTTWVVEVQASANAVLSYDDLKHSIDFNTKNSSERDSDSDESTTSLLLGSSDFRKDEYGTHGDDPFFGAGVQAVGVEAEYDKDFDWWYRPTGEESRFNMSRRIEMGVMSEIFLGWWGQKFFYLVLIIYLVGDLAIYAVTVPQSLATVTGGWGGLSQNDVYYVYLAIFGGVAVPFCFFNFQKTKFLQITTATLRYVALITMMVLAFIFIGEGDGADPSEIHVFRIEGFGDLFGVAIYSFMCHHSLPSLITPVKDKKHTTKMLFLTMCSIFVVYNLLNYSAVFAFGTEPYSVCSTNNDTWACKLQDLYTLNFIAYSPRVIGYFLALFPVFTLSTNYPLIAITLRNNLRQFFQIGIFAEENEHKYPKLHKYQSHFWSAWAAIPPFVIAYATRDVDTLVNVTGSYAGLFIMWVIPAVLLIYSRRFIKKHHKLLSKTWNKHQTPFEHISWQIGLLVISGLSLIYITADDIYKLTQ